MQFKPKFAAIALPLLASCFNVHAAPSAEVKVIGTLVPPACTFTLDGKNVFDYGQVVPADAEKDLGEKTMPFSIVCEAPTKVAIHPIDQRAGSVKPGMGLASFGLGKVNDKNIGQYTLSMTKPVDTSAGALTTVLSKSGPSGPWSKSEKLEAGSMSLTSWGKGGDPKGTIPIVSLQGELVVSALVYRKAELPPLTEEIKLDGLATLEIVYI
jgi:type 1 fimbria pilin